MTAASTIRTQVHECASALLAAVHEVSVSPLGCGGGYGYFQATVEASPSRPWSPPIRRVIPLRQWRRTGAIEIEYYDNGWMPLSVTTIAPHLLLVLENDHANA